MLSLSFQGSPSRGTTLRKSSSVTTHRAHLPFRADVELTKTLFQWRSVAKTGTKRSGRRFSPWITSDFLFDQKQTAVVHDPSLQIGRSPFLLWFKSTIEQTPKVIKVSLVDTAMPPSAPPAPGRPAARAAPAPRFWGPAALRGPDLRATTGGNSSGRCRLPDEMNWSSDKCWD